MTSAISRAATAAHAHGFAKSVKNETPAAEGFEALFAAAANPVTTPAVLPPGGEPGKPGENARDDEKKAAPTAFEVAAAMALVAVDGGRSEVRAMPKTVAPQSHVDVDQAPGATARVVPHAPMEFVVARPVRAPAFAPTVLPQEAAKKPELIEAPVTHVQRGAPELKANAVSPQTPPQKTAPNPIPAKAAPMPIVESEPHVVPVARHATLAPPHPEVAEPKQPVERPRVELSPRALAQAAIVEAIRSPGRGRSQPASDIETAAPKIAEPVAPTPVPVANAVPNIPAPLAEAIALAADAAPQTAKPITVSLAPNKPAAASRAAADILRQRQYALGTDTSLVGDIVPESAASFDALIALRKADGAFDGHASPAAEHESVVPAGSGSWLANLPSSAQAATSPASAIAAPRGFDQTAWSNALAQQVTASAIAAAKETTVRVEPEGLGPIEVRVRVSSEHVDVRFAIEHPVTVNMIRAALPDLEKMLAQSGLNLGDAQIAQQNTGQHGQPMPNRNASSSSTHDDEPIAVASAVESRPRARVGLLDDFV